MSMINMVAITGRLTKDVELRYTPNGVAVANFTVAVNRTYTNQEGVREADFIQVVAWKGTAESTANFMRKGSLVGIEGRIQTRTYESDDKKMIYVTEVVAEQVHFLESKKEEKESVHQNQKPYQNQNKYQKQNNQNNR